MDAWISTGAALKLMNLGICATTFREKFRDCLPWKLTPGGHIRWNRAAIQELAEQMPEAC